MENPTLKIIFAPEGALEIVNKAYRICYESEAKEKPGTREDFIKGFLRVKHESPIEHIGVIFELTGVSRACTQQIERHRIGSYNERSLRYVDATNIECVTPVGIEKNPEALKLYNQVVSKAKSTYKKLLELGVKKEDARACLPLSTTSHLLFTYNLRQIRHFLSERLSPRAQREVRLVATLMYQYMEDLYPWLVEDLADAYKAAVARNEEELK